MGLATYEDICCILSCHVNDRPNSARVPVYKAGNVIDPVVKHNPTIGLLVVCCHLHVLMFPEKIKRERRKEKKTMISFVCAVHSRRLHCCESRMFL